MRRVVVTGVGCIGPFGSSIEQTWKQLLEGHSGIRSVESLKKAKVPVTIGAPVLQSKELCLPTSLQQLEPFDCNRYLSSKDQKRMDKFIHYGFSAATLAWKDAYLDQQTWSEEALYEMGVMIGSGIGGTETIQETTHMLNSGVSRKLSPFCLPGSIINMISGQVAIRYGLKGPNHACATACATGSHAVGDSFRMIQRGDANLMLAGGAESTLHPLAVNSFHAMRALAVSYNNNPELASRPWDKDREGFVMSEGGAVLVLEEYEHAKARGARIYAEIVGYGLSGDGYHITQPASSGEGGRRAMEKALRSAGIGAESIGYINAHGTSTQVGDAAELTAIETLFKDTQDLAVSSTKSSTGHMLGATGAVEAIFSMLAMRDSHIPPTLNLDTPFRDTWVDLTPKVAKDKKVSFALSNSFGFGGTNVSLIFKKL